MEYNSNGILIGEINVVNGSKQGKIALYYDNGQIMDEHFEKNNSYRIPSILKELDTITKQNVKKN